MSNNNTINKITARDKYNRIVEGFISKLENNDVEPWSKSWNMSSSMPKNFDTGNSYNGMNILTLLDRGFKDSRFLTFNQVKNRGGSIKKGETSTPIFFMKPTEKTTYNEATGEEEIEKYFLMQSYNVFNIEQTQGIEYEKEVIADNKDHSIQQWIDNFGIDTFKGEPAYSPNDDAIFMPHYHEFENENEYYSTYFHELGHYTGHKDRLDRFDKHTVYGDEKYAFEELIAELNSAFLSKHHGIEPNSKKSASYLSHWITALKERPNILYSAASHASKASNYLIETNDMKRDLTPSEALEAPFDIDLSRQPTQKLANSKKVSNTTGPSMT